MIALIIVLAILIVSGVALIWVHEIQADVNEALADAENDIPESIENDLEILKFLRLIK